MTSPELTATVTTHEDEEYLPWSSSLAPFSARSDRATYVVRASSGTTLSLKSGATDIVVGVTFTNVQDPRSSGTILPSLRQGWFIDKFIRYPDEATLVTTAVNVNVSNVALVDTPLVTIPVYIDASNVAFVDPLFQLEKHEVTVRHLEHRLHTLFEDNREEILESGFESMLSRSLSSELIHHGLAFVEALSRVLSTLGRQDAEPAFASLHLIGRIKHPLSHDARLNLLVRALRSPFAMVRDGAGVGLALLNDARAIPSLRVALSQEQVGDLREDLSQVLAQLERSSGGGVTS
jgi:hypothetical protein